MKANSIVALAIAFAGGLGSWLMQQSVDATWVQLTTPQNVGSLLLALVAVGVGAFGVKTGTSQS